MREIYKIQTRDKILHDSEKKALNHLENCQANLARKLGEILALKNCFLITRDLMGDDCKALMREFLELERDKKLERLNDDLDDRL
jgi:hypothetical protein